MTMAQAREAAKQVRESLQRLEKLFPSIREGKSNFTIMSDFILDHFPEDGEEMVTCEWLIDDWGFTPGAVTGAYYQKSMFIYYSGNGSVLYVRGVQVLESPTRHQARQLFQVLGIKKRGEA